jgi:hypothetical protein
MSRDMKVSYNEATGEIISINSEDTRYNTINIDERINLSKPDGYSIKWNHLDCDNYVVVSGKFMTRPESDIIERRIHREALRKQALVKRMCQDHILKNYPVPIQLSMSIGVYPQGEVEKMSDFIAGCIAEENRVYDELNNASSMESIELINPRFPGI